MSSERLVVPPSKINNNELTNTSSINNKVDNKNISQDNTLLNKLNSINLSIDSLLITYLNLLSDSFKLRYEVSVHMSSGYYNLQNTRHNSRYDYSDNNYINRNFFNSVNINISNNQFLLQNCEIPNSPTDDSNVVKSNDPLLWFGRLSPPSLKKCQIDFKMSNFFNFCRFII